MGKLHRRERLHEIDPVNMSAAVATTVESKRGPAVQIADIMIGAANKVASLRPSIDCLTGPGDSGKSTLPDAIDL